MLGCYLLDPRVHLSLKVRSESSRQVSYGTLGTEGQCGDRKQRPWASCLPLPIADVTSRATCRLLAAGTSSSLKIPHEHVLPLLGAPRGTCYTPGDQDVKGPQLLTLQSPLPCPVFQNQHRKLKPTPIHILRWGSSSPLLSFQPSLQ